MAWDDDVESVGKLGLGVGAVLLGIAALTGKCQRDAPLFNYDKKRPAQEATINSDNTYNGQTTITNTYINGNNNNVRTDVNVNSKVGSDNAKRPYNSSKTTESSDVSTKTAVKPQKKPINSVPATSIDDTVENTPGPSANSESSEPSPYDMWHAGFRNGNAYFENPSGVQFEISPARYNQIMMVNGNFMYGDYILHSMPHELREIAFETQRSIDNQLRNDPAASTVGRIRNVPQSRGASTSYWSGRAMNRMNTTVMLNVSGGRGTYMHPGWAYGPYLNGRH